MYVCMYVQEQWRLVWRTSTIKSITYKLYLKDSVIAANVIKTLGWRRKILMKLPPRLSQLSLVVRCQVQLVSREKKDNTERATLFDEGKPSHWNLDRNLA